MRWLESRAVAIVCSAVLCGVGCLTTQEEPSGDGGVEDPPITLSGGSGGSISQGGDAGESTGGRERGGSGGTTSGGGSDGGCSDDSDCESRIDGRSRCSLGTGECVACLSAADCDTYAECVDNACRPITICSTATDCPPGNVCNTATDRCVECVNSGDCAASEVCVSSTCRERCTVDSHCTPSGQRCDVGSGYCVDCNSHSDCDESRHCDAVSNTCVRDVCVAGSSTCQGNGYTGCDADGSMEIGFTPCTTMQICVEEDDGARCADQICTPNAVMCSMTDETVVTCSDDGLTLEEGEDCALADQVCIAGVCSDALCEPNTNFCANNTIQRCDATGNYPYTLQTCPTNQFCNPNTIACAARLCVPNQPACNGTLYTTCTADGFGFATGGTDCSMTDQFCGPMGCTTSAVDVIPTTTPTLYASPGPYLMVNYYSVTSARNLALIEYYMNPPSASTLTWIVYESTTTSSGPYNRIHMSTTTSTTGEGYQSSGAVSIPLVAGRFYAIGVSWTLSTMYFSYNTATASQMTSFGALIGGYVTTGTASPPTTLSTPQTSYFVSQRLTTVP